MGERARPAAAAGATGHHLPGLEPSHPPEVVDGGEDDVAPEAGPRGDVVEGGRAPLEGLEHRVERSDAAHQNNRPTWNTSTAASQATVSCTPTPNAVHRAPISRRWAARVATHGV